MKTASAAPSPSQGASTRTAAVVLLLGAAAPASLTAQESRFLDYPMTVQFDVRVPMADGLELSADVYQPADGGRHPTTLELTPYNNQRCPGSRCDLVTDAWHYVRRGYAYVAVDVRGRYDSDGGPFEAFRYDGPDGSQVIDWIVQQPWSNGKVATLGGSYTGMNQWLIAKENNPHHVAMVPYVAPADGFNDLVRYNGVPKLDLIYTWTMAMFGRVNQFYEFFDYRGGTNWVKIMGQLPLNRLDETAGRSVPFWRDWMEHDELDAWWDVVQMTGHYEKFDIPSFNVTGWWDGQLPGTVKSYTNAVRTGRNTSDHKLIIGPWLHGVNRTRRLGERDFGPEAILGNLDRLRDEWLDHHMLGTTRPDQPNVLYFVQGSNEWKSATAWPPPEAEFVSFYLDSDGQANTLLGNGRLQRDRPGSGPPDEYSYDPANPVPTLSSRTAGSRSGIAQGSVDNRAAQTRQDVLVYTSAPLATGVEVTGPVEATIYFSADVPDTDITVKLLEVYPDGRALNLSNGVARARYRNSYAQPAPITPGEVVELKVELFATSNYFSAGHRIQVEVSSSNFPKFGRNLNTGLHNEMTTEMRVARIKIHHDQQHRSRITLPIIKARPATDGS